MPAKSAASEPQLSFESAVERLEQIVELMESDKMPLDDLLVRYEEGTKLVRFCQQQLESAEKRIEIVTRNARGEAKVESFEPEKAAANAPAAKPAPKDEISLF
ncbi:MAG TPA: exodeoxyribonuclease VII small subunit [Chthoniobacteraceae bacterium]|nr:exodeoxyribonuclease VII small subunit [Chthoniobacteraceae bacterium]